MSDPTDGPPGPAAGPPGPFLCDAVTPIPDGWQRGDPARTDPNQLAVAYDPRRHTVVSLAGPGAGHHLAAAGFTPLPAGADPATARIFVRDRTTAMHRRPAPAKTSGRAL